MAAFVAYVFLANSRCEVESPQSLNWTVSPRSEPQKEQQAASNAKSGKKSNSRTAVPAAPPIYSVTQEDSAKEKAEHAEQKGSNWLTKFFCDAKISDLIIAFFSYVLAVATGWLGWATIGLWRASNDEFTASHRPKIRIKHLWLTGDLWQGEPIVVKLTCVNYGTAVALLQEVGIKFHIIRNDRSLPEPKIDAVHRAGGARLECGPNYEFPPYDNGTILTPEQNVEIQKGRSKLFCVGYVSYQDGAGRMRITGFCRVLTFPDAALAHIGNCRFRVFPDPDYEYED